MLRLTTPTDDENALEPAAAALKRGELVILPTDTLYALACQAGHAEAPQRVRVAKGRDGGKPLPLVAGEAAQLEALCGPLPATAKTLIDRFWPGPLTLVLSAAPAVSDAITSGGGTVAVRVPAHDFLRRLCRRVGPLVSTSANRSGRPAPRTCAEALAEVGESVTLAVDAGPGRAQLSTIVDVTGTAPKLLRAGAIAWLEIAAALRRGPA